MGETLCLQWQAENSCDQFAVTVMKNPGFSDGGSYYAHFN